MKKKSPFADISPSICEAAFERYKSYDDSLAELIKKDCIEVRDFIILSFVHDQGELDVEQITRVLGLSDTTTRYCVDRLIEAGLVRYEQNGDGSAGNPSISLTPTGRMVTQRIHSAQDQSK